MTVRSTVSQVPQAGAAAQELAAPQPELHELAPQGLQLDAHGAEQQELTLLPQQLPACADAVMTTTAASDKNIRIRLTPPKTQRQCTNKQFPSDTPRTVLWSHQQNISPEICWWWNVNDTPSQPTHPLHYAQAVGTNDHKTQRNVEKISNSGRCLHLGTMSGLARMFRMGNRKIACRMVQRSIQINVVNSADRRIVPGGIEFTSSNNESHFSAWS
jgi:hypothetical protein